MSHSFTDDTIDSRKSKSKTKRFSRGHSLEEPAQDGGSSHMKSASSETMLADGLMVPETGRKASSRLSLIGEKLADSARALTDRGSKKGKSSPFGLFKKKSSRDPSPSDRTKSSRSTEYHSLDRPKSGYRTGGRSPNRAQTLPITRISDEGDANGTDGVLNLEAPRGIIPYEFQDAIGRGRDFGSEGSEPDQSEADWSEMQALAEAVDEYYYSVRIFPGQDPGQVFVGWMTPGFHFMESSFELKKTRHSVVSVLDNDYRIKTRYLYLPPHDKTNKMACAPSEDLDQPRHLPSLIRVGCALNE